ncbi:MAG: hypothetical protein M1827_004488 [Pycnora praestabilis]|nr:MAG: hypothetical protein M1827_004488 [Pycnora praestabilis]
MAGGWFGSLQLAYKYAIVLGSLLFLTLIAGVTKVLISRRKLKQHIQKANLEAASKQDETHELNTRELDEGDLFGVRAIESGYFGGVAQSRPTSTAGSPAQSRTNSLTNTLIGSHLTPKMFNSSPGSSTTTLPQDARKSQSPLSQQINTHDQDDEIRVAVATRMRVPSAMNIGLRPSQAELSGRRNHDPAVNMNLNVPPSPVLEPRRDSYGSETESDPPSPGVALTSGHQTEHYAPVPQLHLPDHVQMSARPISTPNNPAHGIKSLTGSIISGTDSDGSRGPAPNVAGMDFPPVPSRPIQREPSLPNRRSYQPSKPDVIEVSPMINRSRGAAGSLTLLSHLTVLDIDRCHFDFRYRPSIVPKAEPPQIQQPSVGYFDNFDERSEMKTVHRQASQMRIISMAP